MPDTDPAPLHGSPFIDPIPWIRVPILILMQLHLLHQDVTTRITTLCNIVVTHRQYLTVLPLSYERYGVVSSLVLETFLKFGKLQCKSYFNRNYVILPMIDNFETNQIVLYLRGGSIMHLETTCHVSHVTCQV